MNLDWQKIVSNSVTVLVATVFVGAASYLWKGVDTIDDRIDENVSSIRATQEVIAPKVDELERAIAILLDHHRALCVNLNHTNDPPPVFKFDDEPTFDQIQQQQQRAPR
jgi:2,3-bisphosphoglycerate-independent phosphoglycerate mutase